MQSAGKLTAARIAELEQAAKKSMSPPAAMNADEARWFEAAQMEAHGRHDEAAARIDGVWDAYEGETRALLLLAHARNLLLAGNALLAARRLSSAVKSAVSYRTLAAADRLIKQLRAKAEVASRRRTRVALLGSMTLEFWLPALRAQCFASGIEADFHIGPFGQYQQELLNPDSSTTRFRPDIVVLATDPQFPAESEHPDTLVAERVENLRSLWKKAREMGAFVIQLNAEIPAENPYGRLSASLPGGLGRMLRSFNLALWDAERAESGVAVFDLDQAAAKFGKQSWRDPVLWHTAKQYPSPAATPTLTHHLTGLFRAVLGLSAKCVAVDLDGVMWGGVIGEDGLTGIQIGGGPVGEAHAHFQQYLKSLAARGILLAVCSKNNREDALAPFREHREMLLREEDFAVFVANWENKDQNLREIARLLNIGLDAIVFCDDNPMERARVRQNIPEIEVVEMPADPAGYVTALDAPLYFEALTLTEEDRVRGRSLRENQERALLETQAANVDDYLAGLDMKVELTPFNAADLARIVQLINKTNQFHLTTRRMNENEVRSLMEHKDNYTQSLRVSDRFGDSGLTGVLIAVREGDCLRIHNWLMSCRVMGRRLEEAVFASLCRFARSTGAAKIIGEYIPTPKNEVVSELYLRLGLMPCGDGRFHWAAGEGFEPPVFLKIVDNTN